MKKYLNKKAAIYIALALVCAMAGTALGMANPQAEADTVVLTSPFTAAIEEVQDSVVGVYNYQVVSNRGGGYSYIPWDYFGYGGYGYGYGDGYGYGYGDGRTQPGNSSEVKYASGSGVVIAEGYVLTNFHVIEGASSLKIAVGGNDSDLYDAEVAAYEESKDIAVLYVPGLPVEPVELGDSDKLVVGDWAICIGNAVGFNGTVTAGIISGLDREVESDTSTLDRFGRRTNAVNTMIQTDAAINNGNSGGGLFNTAGQLVGIPTLKYSGMQYTGGAMIESIGMCIPINTAKPIIEEALKGRKAEDAAADNGAAAAGTGEEETNNDLAGKPRMGVTVVNLNTNGVLPNGAYIVEVEKESPAEKAGLKPGDTIVEVNGEVISDTNGLMEKLEPFNAGDKVTVTVWRPDRVTDAGRGRISVSGQYVENIEVGLELLDGVAR